MLSKEAMAESKLDSSKIKTLPSTENVSASPGQNWINNTTLKTTETLILMFSRLFVSDPNTTRPNTTLPTLFSAFQLSNNYFLLCMLNFHFSRIRSDHIMGLDQNLNLISLYYSKYDLTMAGSVHET